MSGTIMLVLSRVPHCVTALENRSVQHAFRISTCNSCRRESDALVRRAIIASLTWTDSPRMVETFAQLPYDLSKPMRSPLRIADSSSDPSSNNRRSSSPRRARSSRSVGLTLSTTVSIIDPPWIQSESITAQRSCFFQDDWRCFHSVGRTNKTENGLEERSKRKGGKMLFQIVKSKIAVTSV